MSDQPHYPYADGNHAVLGPEVTATADGMTICWKGANYRRDHGEHVGAATPLICSDERHAAKVAALQADLDHYEEHVVGDLNEKNIALAQRAGRAEAAIARVRSLAADMRESADTRWFADQLTGALDGEPSAPATTRYIHVTITNRDEYTANRAALSLVDWIHAEFPGLQVTTDAREWTATAATEATEPHTGLVIQPYRNDRGEHVWVFRCWGSDSCDGWLSLDHTSQQSAERARDRHVAEEHAEAQPEPDDPTQCSGEEGVCPEHGFHRHSLKQPGEPEPATITDPEYLRGLYSEAIRRWWDADDGGAGEIADAVMRVRDRHVQQLRQRLELADQAHRDTQQYADRLADTLRQVLTGYDATGCLNHVKYAEYAAVLGQPKEN